MREFEQDAALVGCLFATVIVVIFGAAIMVVQHMDHRETNVRHEAGQMERVR